MYIVLLCVPFSVYVCINLLVYKSILKKRESISEFQSILIMDFLVVHFPCIAIMIVLDSCYIHLHFCYH
jgi:hypothetical protein